MDERFRLVCMRLVDMARIHPAQDNSHVCLKCGERVGIYPTGQIALQEHPEASIICAPCAKAQAASGAVAVPAGSFDQILREVRESKDASKA